MVACGCTYPDFVFNGAGGGDAGAGGSNHATCSQVHFAEGCCDTDGTLYYCDTAGVAARKCAAGYQCGWDDLNLYYGCVPPPVMADPSGTFPMACGQ